MGEVESVCAMCTSQARFKNRKENNTPNKCAWDQGRQDRNSAKPQKSVQPKKSKTPTPVHVCVWACGHNEILYNDNAVYCARAPGDSIIFYVYFFLLTTQLFFIFKFWRRSLVLIWTLLILLENFTISIGLSVQLAIIWEIVALSFLGKFIFMGRSLISLWTAIFTGCKQRVHNAILVSFQNT